MSENKRFGISLLSKSRQSEAYNKEVVMDKATGEIGVNIIDADNSQHNHIRSYDSESRSKLVRDRFFDMIKAHEPLTKSINIYELHDDAMALPFTTNIPNGNTTINLINYPTGNTTFTDADALVFSDTARLHSMYIYIDYTAFNKAPVNTKISKFSNKDLNFTLKTSTGTSAQTKTLELTNGQRISKDMLMGSSDTKLDILDIIAKVGALRTGNVDEHLTLSIYGIYVGVVIGKG